MPNLRIGMHSLAVYAIFSLILAVDSLPAQGREIKDPIFDKKLVAQEAQDYKLSCPTVPKPEIAVNGTAFYIDKDNSKIDPELLSTAIKQESAVRNFTRQLANMVSNADTGIRGDTDRQHCIIHWLAAWAQVKALTGKTEGNGNNYRIWALVPIAQAYNYVRNNTGRYDKELIYIQYWIDLLARINEQNVQKGDIRNNISYWASAGLALAAIATQKGEFLEEAVRLARRGIAAVTSDGFFPGELNRGQRALEYHGFALGPLAITAEVAFANGIDLFSLNNQALYRVGLNLIHSENDTSAYDAKSGVRQDAKLPLSIGNFGWTEILIRHYDSPELRDFVKFRRPIVYDRMGGNLTSLYSRRR